jgi:Zn-dependent peptidase ImmA (M78 family)
MHGFACRIDGQIGIIIDSQLAGSQLSCARAHELGHAMLHDHAGHYLIAESTFIPPGRYEREAGKFAQALLGEES